MRSQSGVVTDDREWAVAVAQNGVADRTEHRFPHPSSSSDSDHEQGSPVGLGEQRLGRLTPHEHGLDRDTGERGPPPVQRAIEDTPRDGFGEGRGTGDRFKVTGRVRDPGMYGDNGDAALTGGVERKPDRGGARS